MKVSGTLAYDGSDRELELDQWLDGGWQDAVLDAYLDGADVAELGAILFEYLDDSMPPFYHQMFDPDVSDQWHLDIEHLDWGGDDE